ncbi:MAG: hypothetical protein NT145_03605 [Elusimicrobia bacterium]|nr:hypothetical protein [Elusimicrobiota bacterium]
MPKPLLTFHANFIKVSGPMISGETRIQFDVPELFENEVEGIVRLLKNRNLLISIYDVEETNNIEEENTTESIN